MSIPTTSNAPHRVPEGAIVIYGPQGCGKTRNGPELAKAYGKRHWIDNWTPGGRRIPRDHIALTGIEGIEGAIPFETARRKMMAYHRDLIRRTRDEKSVSYLARICACHDDLLEVAYQALPFIEEAQTDPLYKTGAAGKVLAFIRKTIDQAEGRA